MASKLKTPVHTPRSSPAQQSTLQSLNPTPPPPPQYLTLADLQGALQEALKIQNETLKTQTEEIVEKKVELMAEQITQGLKEEWEIKNKEIREDIIFAITGIAKHVVALEERVEEVNQANLKLEDEAIEIQHKLGRVEEENLMLQYREMEFALRIRGLKENQQENLKEIFAKVFAETLDWQRNDFIEEIEKAFRVNSWYARQKKLPRDVVIYFTKRWIRNDIIQAFYNNRFKVENQEVLILKEIPPKMLRERKQYTFLTDELKRRQFPFRWETPTGLVVNYLGARHRLNTVSKAKDFYYNVLKAGSSSPKAKERNREESQKQIDEQVISAEKEIQQLLDLEVPEPREQRMTRATTRRMQQERMEQQQQPKPKEAGVSEAVGGARSKRPIDLEVQEMLQKLQGNKHGN